jgi:hypothetical protein
MSSEYHEGYLPFFAVMGFVFRRRQIERCINKVWLVGKAEDPKQCFLK